MKAAKAEIMKRVEAILEIRLAGAEFADIRKYAQENGWQVSDGQLWRYIRKTDDLLAQSRREVRSRLAKLRWARRCTGPTQVAEMEISTAVDPTDAC
jgi:hypothetical protein